MSAPYGERERPVGDRARSPRFGEVLCGARAGRRSADVFTLFKSTGHAVEDIAAASLVHERALAADVGTTLSL